METKEYYYVQCAVCATIQQVDDIDQLPDGWIVNEEDYTFRCDNWECQDIGAVDDILDYYDHEEDFDCF